MLGATYAGTQHETISRRGSGWRATRLYRVNTQSPVRAVLTPGIGLPPVGSAFSGDIAGLICVGYEPERRGGQDTDAAEGANGWTDVKVIYETPSASGSAVPPGSGLQYTRIQTGTRTERQLFGINPATGEPTPGGAQIGGGAGAEREVGLLTLTVHVPIGRNGLTGPLLQRIVALNTLRPTNADAVTLPAMLGDTLELAFSPGQLRYGGFEVGEPDADGARYLVHALHAAEDHKVRWPVEGPDGQATETIAQADVYTAEAFAGLW